MIEHHPGQRVALTHIIDPHSTLRPGEQGVVRTYDPGTQVVTVRWDTGTITDIRLAAGDRLDVLASPTPVSEPVWQTTLAAVTERGRGDGHRAVTHWIAQQTGHPTASVTTTARQILQALADHDLDDTTLPRFATNLYAQPPSTDQLSDLLAAVDPAAWQPVDTDQREQAAHAYRDGFDTAVATHSGAWARRTLIPAADGRDLAQLQPAQARVGRIGVFSGEWMWAHPVDGPDYLRIGFVGTMVQQWNGWAVFSCTRQVAEAIVADQQHQRTLHRNRLQRAGMPAAEAHRQVDQTMVSLAFVGDAIVVDQRVMLDDPGAVERITPDHDGRYVVMGGSWQWEAVDPYRCDRIVGDLPAAGDEQQFVALTHTPEMRLPHDRLRLDPVRRWAVPEGLAYVGAVLWEGQPVGVAGNEATGGDSVLALTVHSAAEPLQAFVTACRYQGQPVGMSRLLDALADEAYLTEAVRQAPAGGGTLLRAVDDSGRTCAIWELHSTWPGPFAVSRTDTPFVGGPSIKWQLWDGQAWQTVQADSGPVA